MDDLSFTTFLKLALMPTMQRRLSELQRMHSGDRGYDFYKQMKFAAKGVARGEIDPDVIIANLETIKRPAERTHNVQMAKNFLTWWNSLKGAEALTSAPNGTYKSDAMHFGIKMRPELAYVKDGTTYVVYLWATQLPAMTNQIAGAGLQILRGKLAAGTFKDAKFSLLNLRTMKTLTEELISNQSKTVAQADIASINELWKSLT